MSKYFLILFLIVNIFVSCGGDVSTTSSTQDTIENDEQTIIKDSTTNNDEIISESWYKPTSNTTWQWQLTNTLNTSYDVELYDIDLFDTPQAIIDDLHNKGKKVICYFSAGSYEDWRADKNDFPDSIKGNDLDGWADEKWLDISKLDLLKPIMDARFDIAKEKKCDGVEPDNVDGYTNNTGFSLTYNEQLEYNRYLANAAHKRGLSIALKNDLDQINDLELYFDFAVNEQCNQYNECDYYDKFINSNKAVLNAEYNDKYKDDDNMTKLCNYTNNKNFSTLILPMDLNDSFRYDCKDYFYNQFNVGYGGAASFKFYDNKWLNSTDILLGNYDGIKDEIVDFNETQFNTLSTYLNKSKYVTYWITKGWQEYWFDLQKIQEAIDAGKIPVFVYWYLGDELMNGLTTSKVDEYLEDIRKVNNYFSNLKGQQLWILEPEFNKQNILDNNDEQSLFIDTIKQAVNIIKNKERKISLCMMDTGARDVNSTKVCGYENCSYGDNDEWDRVKPIYNALIDELDFISFQEMIGQFSRDDSNPGTWDEPNAISHTDDELGINNLAKRIDNFARHLKTTYNKPVYLPYITIATATWTDINDDGNITNDEINESGWEDKASNVYRDLNSTSLFGYSIMELFDNPTHDDGGYQYFIDNEYHLGIVKSDINNSQLTGNIKFKGTILENVFK